MATLNENIAQAVKDSDEIRDAIQFQRVDVPEDASTSEYREKIKDIDRGVTPTGTLDITEVVTGDSAFSNTGLHNVHYTGTGEERSQIEVADGNGTLLNATIHYNYTKEWYLECLH